MDAAPLLGTAASYSWMTELIQEGSMSDIETDMWLSSLAFQTNPSSEMISSVTVILSTVLNPNP